MHPRVTVLISFNLTVGPTSNFFTTTTCPWPKTGSPTPGKASQRILMRPLASPVPSQSLSLSLSLSAPFPGPLSSHVGAATHRSTSARVAHCGAHSLAGGVSGGSSQARELHFPKGNATPSASPCSSLEAEASRPLSERSSRAARGIMGYKTTPRSEEVLLRRLRWSVAPLDFSW